MTTLIVAIAAGICVAAVVGAVAVMFRNPAESAIEDRLDVLAGKTKGPLRDLAKKEQSVLSRPLDDVPSAVEEFFARFFNLQLLLEQADIAIKPVKFLTICGGLAFVGIAIGLVVGVNSLLIPVIAVSLATLPIVAVFLKRRSRLKKFTKQLPEALDLVSRALRAGHSLGAGFQLVSNEVPDPLGVEFGRVYEEQNLGIALEQALDNMCERVPNLDLRFFATAVVLQRTTGGDLAEILEKIGHLIRERFKIWGQIQALTGEGRLSGIVLLALPPVLMVVMWRLNPEYIMMLFTDPMGKQMLGVAAGLQILGALVIKKIVNIKV